MLISKKILRVSKEAMRREKYIYHKIQLYFRCEDHKDEVRITSNQADSDAAKKLGLISGSSQVLKFSLSPR